MAHVAASLKDIHPRAVCVATLLLATLGSGPAAAEPLRLVAASKVTLEAGTYEYDYVYIGGTSRLELAGDVVLKVAGPVRIFGRVVPVHLDQADGKDGLDGKDGDEHDAFGNGAPGTAGTDGEDGKQGFSLTIEAAGEVYVEGTVDLAGGRGGNGGRGGEGLPGMVTEATVTDYTAHVRSGGDGGAGGRGGRGGDGGSLAILSAYSIVFFETAEIRLNGGDGGRGGAGGAGADGNAACAKMGQVHGGKGGDGGMAGAGGHSGSLTLAAAGCVDIRGTARVDLHGGAGGSFDPEAEPPHSGRAGSWCQKKTEEDPGGRSMGYAWGGGGGVNGGDGGSGGNLRIYSAGAMELDLHNEIVLSGGRGGNGQDGGRGGAAGNVDWGFITACEMQGPQAAGGPAGPAGRGGNGGAPGTAALHSFDVVMVQAALILRGGDGGAGGTGGAGGSGGVGNTLCNMKPYYKPWSMGQAGAPGGAGGSGGAPGYGDCLVAKANGLISLDNVQVRAGDGGRGGRGGDKGRLGVEFPAPLIENDLIAIQAVGACKFGPGVGGAGGSVPAAYSARIHGPSFFGQVGASDDTKPGSGGDAGAYLPNDVCGAYPMLTILVNDGAPGTFLWAEEPTLTVVRLEEKPYFDASQLLSESGFTVPASGPSAEGRCGVCLDPPDPIFSCFPDSGDDDAKPGTDAGAGEDAGEDAGETNDPGSTVEDVGGDSGQGPDATAPDVAVQETPSPESVSVVDGGTLDANGKDPGTASSDVPSAKGAGGSCSAGARPAPLAGVLSVAIVLGLLWNASRRGARGRHA